MTTDDDLQRQLRSWLAAEAPIQERDGLFQTVSAGSRHMRQRPALIVALRGGGLGDPGTRRIWSMAVVGLVIALLAAALIAAAGQIRIPSPPLELTPTGVFTPTGRMHDRRALHTATLLPDGRVLVLGGAINAGFASAYALATAEIWDPATGAFGSTSMMAAGRGEHTATLLPDGRVLVVGGYGGYSTNPALGDADVIYATAEVWDPRTGRFTPTGSMAAPRFDHTATLLPDGRVLIQGGFRDLSGTPATNAEVWDPVNGSFGPATPQPVSVDPPGTVRLADGRLLSINLHGAAIVDPTTGTAAPTGPMTDYRSDYAAVLRPDGSVLVTGGEIAETDTCLMGPAPSGSGRKCRGIAYSVVRNYVATAELFDPTRSAPAPAPAPVPSTFK